MTRTLAHVRDANEQLWVNCHNTACTHSAKLDLDKLIGLLGEEHGAMHDDLKNKFGCQICKSEGRPNKNVGFTVIPDYKSIDRQRSTTNPYIKAKGG